MPCKRTEISVLVASPHAITRELLIGALNRHAGFRVVAGASSAQEAFDVVQSTAVDVALMSASLADGPLSGLGRCGGSASVSRR